MTTADNQNNSTGVDSHSISPAEFTPLRGPIKRRRKLRPVAIAVTCALVLAGLVLWFLLSARAIFFDTVPANAQIQIEGAFVFQVSDSYLMHPGSYEISSSAEGYFPATQTIEVSKADSQRFDIVLEKMPGHLELTSTPTGASVTLDGIPRGETPVTIESLSPGAHQLVMSAPRYFKQTLAIDIEGLDKTQSRQVELKPAWGQLTIDSSPKGADVLIAGELRGQTPLTTELLEAGESVKVQLTGHKSWQQTLSVKAGGELVIDDIKLEKVDGLLKLSTNPSGASVTIDNTYRGITPLELALKPDADHSLSLFLNGYQTSKHNFRIASGSEKNLDITLTPETGKLRVDSQPANTQVYIDGQLRGKGGESFALPARAHTIEVRAKGYASQKKTFTPRPGIQQVLQFNLLTEKEARWAATPREITSPVNQKLKLFRPETSFTMGASRREPGRRANEVQREVTLARPFYLATHEVTNAEFQRFNAKHLSRQVGGISLSTPNQPVAHVSWEQAALFCNWLSAKEGLPLFYQVSKDKVTGINPEATGYRLPTEAEWAWAARQLYGNMLKFSWGDSFPPEGKAGNYADRSSAKINSRVVKEYDDGFAVSSPVGRFDPNDKGLYDLSGNVAEWVNDYYGIEINLSGKKQFDPLGPETGEFRVIRGASWRHGSITELRLSYRDYGVEARDDVGFRIARYAE